METVFTHIDSSFGAMLAVAQEGKLVRLWLPSVDGRPFATGGWERNDQAEPFPEGRRQLAAYFEGRLKEFDLPLAPAGTQFQQAVWRALLAIPYGQTTTYGELAKELGDLSASRAVGLANGANPIAIIVPCHRVIGAGGRLVGYSAGVDRKAALLAYEAAVAARGPQPFTLPALQKQLALAGL